jgi:hypothetical protein
MIEGLTDCPFVSSLTLHRFFYLTTAILSMTLLPDCNLIPSTGFFRRDLNLALLSSRPTLRQAASGGIPRARPIYGLVAVIE